MRHLLIEAQDVWQRMQRETDERRRRGELFNVFALCGVGHYETIHSAILAELLRPQGSHGQGPCFLRAFLAAAGLSGDFSAEDAEVFTERTIPDGRIDILLTDGQGHAIIIENKIYAPDQDDQLLRYDHYAQRFGRGMYEMLYLTLHGTDASPRSTGGEAAPPDAVAPAVRTVGDLTYRVASYAETIVAWLETCIGLCEQAPPVRESLIQYRNHIIQLTRPHMDTPQDENLLRLMATHPQETAAVVKAATIGYLPYVYRTYLRPELQALALRHGLRYTELDASQILYGFFFRRPEWKWMTISIAYESGQHYIGISVHGDENNTLPAEEALAALSHRRLTCFDERPTLWWPYGWSYLGAYSDWSASGDAIPAMIDGRFTAMMDRWLTDILAAIDDSGITMI